MEESYDRRRDNNVDGRKNDIFFRRKNDIFFRRKNDDYNRRKNVDYDRRNDDNGERWYGYVIGTLKTRTATENSDCTRMSDSNLEWV